MKRIFLTLCAVVMSLGAWAGIPNKIIVPDIDGYLTLKGDFHVHTVFSDGNVWPTTRVKEALWEGLDVIAITDHLDTRHQRMVNRGIFNGEKVDRDTSYEMAAKEGEGKLIVIHGGEISRGMPPGHWNCLFIEDNDDICAAAEANDHDHMLAMEGGLKEATKQGGFIMWNHPNWEKHAPNETIWWDEHEKLYQEGYMHAIEVYNMSCGYSPEAHEWCLEKDMAIIGNSDIHNPFFEEINYMEGYHRPVTLVFAKERSEAGVKEALQDRRSAIFAEGVVYGREQELLPLYEACVEVVNVAIAPKKITITLRNNSSIPIVLTKNDAPESQDCYYPRYMVLTPFETKDFSVNTILVDHKSQKFTEKVVDVNFNVESFQIGANKPLKYKYSINLEK